MNITIPKGDYDSPAPCWIPTSRYDNGGPAKPLIKCECGHITGIGLHHVHADGRVTAYTHDPGCGWHVFLTLADYDKGDFPPVED